MKASPSPAHHIASPPRAKRPTGDVSAPALRPIWPDRTQPPPPHTPRQTPHPRRPPRMTAVASRSSRAPRDPEIEASVTMCRPCPRAGERAFSSSPAHAPSSISDATDRAARASPPPPREPVSTVIDCICRTPGQPPRDRRETPAPRRRRLRAAVEARWLQLLQLAPQTVSAGLRPPYFRPDALQPRYSDFRRQSRRPAD